MDIEEKVEELINDYGAPDNIAKKIRNFLFQSGNLEDIIDLVEEEKAKEKTQC